MAGGRLIRSCAFRCRGEWIPKSDARGRLEAAVPGLSLAISTEPSHPPLALPHWPPPDPQQNDCEGPGNRPLQTNALWMPFTKVITGDTLRSLLWRAT
jgi:hypothetical protein